MGTHTSQFSHLICSIGIKKITELAAFELHESRLFRLGNMVRKNWGQQHIQKQALYKPVPFYQWSGPDGQEQIRKAVMINKSRL